MPIGQIGAIGRLGLAQTKGVGFSLDAFMASQADGLWFDTTKTDRFFQESTGPTLADDIGEAIGLALDQRTSNGQTLAQVLGGQAEVVTGGDMSSSAGWVLQAGWSITSGALNGNVAASAFTNALPSLAQSLVSAKLYKVSYQITEYTSGSVFFRMFGDSTSNGLSRSAVGSFEEYLVAPANTTSIAFTAGGAGFVGKIDNFSVKLVPDKYGIQATGSLKPSRQTTGAKFDGSDDNWLTPYLASSGANFLGARTTVPSTLAATQAILGASGSGANRVFLGIDTSGRACGGVGSDSTTTIVGTSDLRNTEAELFLTFDGTTVRLIVNGVVEYEAAQNGTPTTSIPFRMGANNNNGTAGSFYAGAVAEAWVGREYITASRANQIAA